MPAATAERPWLSAYPEGVPADVDVHQYQSLVELMDNSFAAYGSRAAYSFLGKDIRYRDIDQRSQALAAYLQGLGLAKGDRVAIMLANVPQYPIAVAAVLRAGFVVVNVNPLYTARELQHQLHDAGATVIVILENFAATLQACMPQTPVKHVLLAAMGDSLGLIKGSVVNHVVRRVKRLVPAFELPHAVRFNEALRRGAKQAWTPAKPGPQDVAVLQYTGGTTGVSKGAVLQHRNIVANLLQSEAWNAPALKRIPAHQQPTYVCALPLYHIFAFTINMMLGMRVGAKNILIPNPRDLSATLKELSRHVFHQLPAVNTLFNGLVNHPDFDQVDWSHLCVSLGGGMAVQEAVARQWRDKTGCAICEGYGLSETSPSACCNPVDSSEFSGTIGVPIPGTDMKILDDDGRPCAPGEAGEIAIKGPQLMAGYWQRPDETAKVMTADGYFKSGDIGVMDARGYFRIVDRKKDMILVSGFNVYPNEIEEVVAQVPGVLECAAVGDPNDETGESVRLVVVRKDASLTDQTILRHCREHLTAYKVPRRIEYRTELPKTPVGKILRRALRSA
ncbi:MAG: long-chain-fatty-acid--CoA ligase [Burkholderiaceae bacterium]